MDIKDNLIIRNKDSVILNLQVSIWVDVVNGFSQRAQKSRIYKDSSTRNCVIIFDKTDSIVNYCRKIQLLYEVNLFLNSVSLNDG